MTLSFLFSRRPKHQIMGLLKGIDPLLTADLLQILRSMGHGNKLIICDCNFPAAEIATHTTTGKHITLTTTLPEALDAICSVLPLDYFEEYQAMIMSPSPGLTKPPAGIEVEAASKEVIVKHSGINVNIGNIERYAFYEEAKNCFAVVHTLERRPYGNVILVKGVIGPDGNDLRPS